MSSPILLPGCRHNILGHYLKAIGILRVLAKCADEDHRDPDAEGWWDMDTACFQLRSPKYPTMEKLVEFLTLHYRPTAVFSPWNTGGGMDEKKEVIFRCDPKAWTEYWDVNKDALIAHGFPKPDGDSIPEMPVKAFDLKVPKCELPETDQIAIAVTVGKQKKPKTTVLISWTSGARQKLFNAMSHRRTDLERGIKFTKPVIDKFVEGEAEFVFNVMDEIVIAELGTISSVSVATRTKESGKKAIMALLAKEFANHPDALHSLSLGRSRFDDFQNDDADTESLLEQFRDHVPMTVAESLDSVFTTRAPSRQSNNPLFLSRGMGDGGNDEMFRLYWVHYCAFVSGAKEVLCRQCLGGEAIASRELTSEVGYPYFPDAIKAYNVSSSWVQSTAPFNGLDYVLAVEGAFAMRGATSRTLAANSKRFAAFPFVFDSGEDMQDENNEIKRTSSSLWFPLWNRATAYGELASFISDAQARLPGKEARFSAEFVRAMNSQGVDAGFSGWQEFRFKMKGSRVPWITTGRYIAASHNKAATQLNRALSPLDESRFMDQFEIAWKGSKADSRSTHPVRAEINAAMETAALDPTDHHCMALLESIYKASRQLAISKSFREKVHGIGIFFDKLPMSDWRELLGGLEDVAEFRIARAIASIPGLQRQHDPKSWSKVQPILGSLLPLAYSYGRWQLDEHSNQAVWTGTDLCHDLTVVLQRRYMDSLKDDQPALRGVHQARLADVMAFLNHELDDHLIARWIEALSLIGWHFEKRSDNKDDDGETETVKAIAAADEAPLDLAEDSKSKASPAVPLAYAALRTLLELECEWQGKDRSAWKKRRSQQPISHLCQRSISSLPVAVSEALRWIGIWGVRNPWGAKSRQEKEILKGRYIIRLDTPDLNFSDSLVDPSRLAAAVCIPLAWEDQWQLRRAITLPFSA